jgi:mannose/cellobiose epimerase-like protein (N-acyl-D-glucosamine 2-epimerase family)
MDRRTFIGTSGAAAALSTIRSGNSDAVGLPFIRSGKPMAVDKDGKLAGKTLKELCDQYIYDLNEYKEFQHKYVVDREYGGYCVMTGWDGPPTSYRKRAWYEGRGTWTFAYLYNNIDPDPRHLEACRRSIEFTMKNYPEGDQFFPANFSREGEPGPREVNLYGDIFIANGFAEYAKTKGNEKYWDIAKEIVLKCVRIYNKPGYNATELTPNGTRYGGHCFILIKCITDMLDFRDDAELKSISDWCIESYMKYHWNPAYNLNNEQINHDFSRPNNELANRVALGHASEVLWMTMNEAVRRKDRALFNECASRFKRNLEVQWDDVYGGVFTVLQNVEENQFTLSKVTWGQVEDLNGLMLVIEHTGEEWAKEWFGKLYTWVMAKLPLKPYGLPLWQDSTGRKGDFVKTSETRRAENMHHPRQLMLNLLSLQRIMKRKGAISGIFG